MQKYNLTPRQWLAIAVIAAVIPAIALWMNHQSQTRRQAQLQEAAALLVQSPSTTTLALPASRTSGELILYEFSPELREAYIHDIIADGGRLWLGTGKGLLLFAEGKYASQYRQFSQTSFEWVQNLTLENGLLAANVLVAHGSTGGRYAGSHLFDIRERTWRKLGKNVLDQVWLNGALYQRPLDRALLRIRFENGNPVTEEIPIQSRLCSEAYMRAIHDELWIAQQGTVHFHGGRRTGGHTKAVPCGVLRYNPQTGEETLYEEGNGLNSGFARDVAGDEKQVWVSHSIKHDKLSLFDPAVGQWQSARPYGSGNRIAVSDRAVWLASPSSRTPLIRIDRATQKRKNIAGIPEEFYVSAIAIDGEEIWLGLYKRTWHGSTYSVESRLARYTDSTES